MKTYDDIGIGIPEILLPRPEVDLSRWAVIACDQFTSQPDYWRDVRALVGDSPSTLRMVLPEIDLDGPDKPRRIEEIQQNMRQYLDAGLLQTREGMLYVERRVNGRLRKGIMLCLDLERYDYSKGSPSLIRATEGTIVDRLPPRMAIREGAALELPHILVLIDDPEHTVIEPVREACAGTTPLYDFELMLDSGHLTGFAIDAAAQDAAIGALRNLAKPEVFQRKYSLTDGAPVLLFAMGDGNHSLATAKAVWEKMKPEVGMDHPARYALVEVNSLHDEGLEFEPIHRVLFGLKVDLVEAMRAHFGEGFSWKPLKSFKEVARATDSSEGPSHAVGVVTGNAVNQFGVVEVTAPTSNLAVGSLQGFLDAFMKRRGAERLDYVHGADVVERLGRQGGNAGLYLPHMAKSSLFKTVILDGALPRKTFSMGEAREKRFYMECRRIS